MRGNYEFQKCIFCLNFESQINHGKSLVEKSIVGTLELWNKNRSGDVFQITQYPRFPRMTNKTFRLMSTTHCLTLKRVRRGFIFIWIFGTVLKNWNTCFSVLWIRNACSPVIRLTPKMFQVFTVWFAWHATWFGYSYLEESRENFLPPGYLSWWLCNFEPSEVVRCDNTTLVLGVVPREFNSFNRCSSIFLSSFARAARSKGPSNSF